MIKVKNEKKTGMILAVCGCVLLFGWYCYAVRFGVGRTDEAYYISVVQRLLNGERLLVDEWHFVQLSSLFVYFPYWLYTRIAGGTEGVILFMRYVYVAVSFLTYWYIVWRLRKMPVRAAACAFLFCSFVPFAIFAVNYYNLPPILLLIVCFILTGEKGRFYRAKLILCGVLVSCVVLMVPQFSALYLIYSVCVAANFFLNKNKKSPAPYAFVLDKTVWGFLSLGVAVSAAVFLIFLAATSGLGNVMKNLPNLFTDSEYSLSSGAGIYRYFYYKISFAVRFFHPVVFVLMLGVLAAALWARFFRGRLKNPTYFRLGVLLAACVVLVTSCVVGAVRQRADPSLSFANWYYHSFSTLPAFFFCLICYGLCKEKNRRAFFFWWVGISCALLRDVLSEVSLGLDCILSVVSLVYIVPQLAGELRTELAGSSKKPRAAAPEKKNRLLAGAFRPVLLSTVAFFMIWNAWNAYAAGSSRMMERWNGSAADTEQTAGPYKGICTSAHIKEVQDKMRSDLDRIAAQTDGPVYIVSLQPDAYLYLDRPYPTYSTWFVEADIATRQIDYWRLYPEKRPAVIYVPDYAYVFDPETGTEDRFRKIEPFFEYEAERGEGGMIVTITRWKL